MRNIIQKIFRGLYDVVMLNVAMVLAINFHYLTFLFRGYPETEFTFGFFYGEVSKELNLWIEYAPSFCVLALGIFYLFGFYDVRRFSRFRHRVVGICLGTILANLSLLVVMYSAIETNYFPRGVSLLFLGFTFLFNAIPRLIKPAMKIALAYLDEPDEEALARQERVHKVLLIGGAGYIGSVLAQHLLENGYQVSVLDELLFGDDSLKELRNFSSFELIRGDCRNIVDIFKALEGVDAVVHLAGLVGDPACAVSSDLTIDINLAATKMLLDICKAKNIRRFIFASTCSVYGVGEEILNETSPLRPVSLYAKTKVDSEEMLLDAWDKGFQPTILRFATVFGLSPRPRFDLVVNTFVAHAIMKKQLRVFGGNQWRPFVHTYDIARCIRSVLEAKLNTVGGQIFNVGDDRLNYTIDEVSKIVSSRIEGTEVVNEGDQVDPRNYRVSFQKVREVLGFTCSKTIENGVDEIVSALDNADKFDIGSSQYNNLMQARAMIASNEEASRLRIHKVDVLEGSRSTADTQERKRAAN